MISRCDYERKQRAARTVSFFLLFTVLSASDIMAQESNPSSAKRSQFRYVDGAQVSDQRYQKPPADTNPADIVIEEQNRRLISLEERIEVLERRINEMTAKGNSK